MSGGNESRQRGRGCGAAGARRIAPLLAALLLAGCGGADDAEEQERPASGGGDPAANREAEGSAHESRPRIRDGGRLLFIGDSLAIEGSPPYPTLLAGSLGGVAVVNHSQPGSSSADWVPDGPLFAASRVDLERADLVFVSVGGNDLQEALGGSDGPEAAAGADRSSATAVGEALAVIERNITRTVGAIRTANPGAEIVYVSYPDYASSERWRESVGALGIVGLRLGLGELVAGARRSGADAVIDLRETTAAAGVDTLLADLEHLGPAGHELYARELVRRLSR